MASDVDGHGKGGRSSEEKTSPEGGGWRPNDAGDDALLATSGALGSDPSATSRAGRSIYAPTDDASRTICSSRGSSDFLSPRQSSVVDSSSSSSRLPSSGGQSAAYDSSMGTSSALSFQPSMADSSLVLPGSSSIDEERRMEASASSASTRNRLERGRSDAEVDNRSVATTTATTATTMTPDDLDGAAREPSSSSSSSSSRHDLDSLIHVGRSMRRSGADFSASLPRRRIRGCGGEEHHLRGGRDEKLIDARRCEPESNWDDMIRTARAALDALGPDGVVAELRRAGYDVGENSLISSDDVGRETLALPPSPPDSVEDLLEGVASADASLPDDASSRMILSSLPPEFACPLCGDLIVGASVTSCGCARSAFCSRCLDDRLTPPVSRGSPIGKELEVIEEEGYVVVNRDDVPGSSSGRWGRDTAAAVAPRHCCPSCNATVRSPPVPCRALDVAILNCVVGSSTNGDDDHRAAVLAFRSRYFARLRERREEVLLLRERASRERELREERLLGALLIQAEEEEERVAGRRAMRRKRIRPLVRPFAVTRGEKRRENRGLQLLGEVVVMVAAAATAALLGVRISSGASRSRS